MRVECEDSLTVEFTDAAEAFLPCCIPYLQSYRNVRVVGDDELLGEEVGSYCGMLDFLEVVVDEAVE